MKKINKYLYLIVLQGNYGAPHYWEDLAAYDDDPQGRKDARADLKEYRIAEPYAAHRRIRRREPNPDHQESI